MVNQQELSARKAKNAYMRAWRAANKDKVKAIQNRYWEKMARKMKTGLEEKGTTDAN
ncbi:hypothetical protein ACQKIW_26535 [Bacillus thuringiensis]|uniref:hypothetical protein n=1 Tax=Bacillus thuringiensis TaxID=1428 RepID=UPI003D036F2D